MIILPSPLYTSAREYEEARDITDYISNNYSFSHGSIFESKSAPISCLAGRTIYIYREPHVIKVCYITESEQQEKIIDLVKDYKNKNKMRSIIIKFYEKEYRRVTPVGRGEVVSSGVEGLLREVKIK
jgi:hypothetical protein